MTSTQRQFRSEPRSGKGKILLLLILVEAYLIVPAPVLAQTATIFNYTGNRLSNGGFITASVTLPCSLPCAPGKYGGASMLGLSLSYGSVTLSWPPGNGAPVDPWITLDSAGNVVDWNVNLIIDSPSTLYPNFTLGTLNTTDPRYQGSLSTVEATLTGSIRDSVTFRQAPAFELHALEYNGNSPGTWVATPVPEPSSLLILGTVGLGLVGLALKGRRC